MIHTVPLRKRMGRDSLAYFSDLRQIREGERPAKRLAGERPALSRLVAYPGSRRQFAKKEP